MANVLCYGWYNAFNYQSAASEAGPGGVMGFWWRLDATTTTVESRRFVAPATTTVGNMGLPTASASASVNPGIKCPNTVPNGMPVVYVVMPVSDYNLILDSAKVVEEIQKSTDYALLVAVVFSWIVGLVVGWKVGGRSEGRSG